MCAFRSHNIDDRPRRVQNNARHTHTHNTQKGKNHFQSPETNLFFLLASMPNDCKYPFNVFSTVEHQIEFCACVLGEEGLWRATSAVNTLWPYDPCSDYSWRIFDNIFSIHLRRLVTVWDRKRTHTRTKAHIELLLSNKLKSKIYSMFRCGLG